MKNQSNKQYQTFTIKASPRDIGELGNSLEYRIKILQEIGWKIDSIDAVNDYYAVDPVTKETVPTPYYIVIAWKEES